MDKWEKDLELSNQRAKAFLDTLDMCTENTRLIESIKRSVARQVVVYEDKVFHVDIKQPKEGNVKVTLNRTFEAALAYKGKRVAVLNFASFLKPGGSSLYKGRSNTQEDCLCRTSTLYPCISDEQCMTQFYERHNLCEIGCYLSDSIPQCYLYNADLIYTPDVTVFKTSKDRIPKLMPESNWFQVDIISMAAPNAEELNPHTYRKKEDEFKDIFNIRFSRVMAAAASNQIDVLILGAFGCGVFNNDPAVVAVGAARALEKLRMAFDTVEFAIYDKGNKNNFRMFRLILDRYLNN